ncbi:MAG: caspase family protein [Bacteroidota bacterium]
MAEKKYYILLVGINDYPAPFTPLNGCLKDVDQLEAYLEEWPKNQGFSVEENQSSFDEQIPIRHIGPLSILKLLNADATYENIHKAFREFLSQARAGKEMEDVVWFHFSGHGSEEYTAEEFLTLEPNGKDQTLVTYNENPSSGQTHLADKEIAVLLSDLADEQGNVPHILVSLDCCHSGSGTRFPGFDMKTRQADVLPFLSRSEARRNQHPFRSLESYSGGFYSKQLEQASLLEIPLVPHILFSACESVQLAGDTSEGGVFTQGLLKALRSSSNNIFYPDLYQRTRATVQKIRPKHQSPTFETMGNFNPYRTFLNPMGASTEGDRSIESTRFYELSIEQGNWYVNCGAIHGIPLTENGKTSFKLLENEQEVASLKLKTVGAQKSLIAIPEGLTLDPSSIYQAKANFLPLPEELVWIHGEEDGVEALKRNWDKSRNIRYLEELEPSLEASLEVEVQNGIFQLKDRKRNKTVFQWPYQTDTEARILVDSLGKIVNWYRVINLNHEKSKILGKGWIDFEIQVLGPNGSKAASLSQSENSIEANEQNFFSRDGNLFAGFVPELIIRDCDQDLYAYLFHMRSNYAIESYEGEVVYRPKEHPGKTEVRFPMWKQSKGWGLSPDETEAYSYFKLIVATESMDYYQLLQSSLEGNKAFAFKTGPMGVKDDWASITMKVSLKRADS